MKSHLIVAAAAALALYAIPATAQNNGTAQGTMRPGATPQTSSNVDNGNNSDMMPTQSMRKHTMKRHKRTRMHTKSMKSM